MNLFIYIFIFLFHDDISSRDCIASDGGVIGVNNESKGYGRKWSELNSRLLSSNLLERTRKIHETLQYI